MTRLLSLILLFLCGLSAFHFMPEKQKPFTYLALGDSYTIGEAVMAHDRWPVQLVARLRKEGLSLEDTQLVATTGWTTAELQEGIRKAGVNGTFDLVSLLIGVNNQYRGYDMAIYEREFTELLQQAIGFAGGKSANVFVVSIPDYGVTPFATEKGLDPAKIARELDEYNALAKRIAEVHGVSFFEITAHSRTAANDASLIASDGLHPSGKMYAHWVETCYSWVLKNLRSR
jgi:lysophospholipase L1-like esterase